MLICSYCGALPPHWKKGTDKRSRSPFVFAKCWFDAEFWGVFPIPAVTFQLGASTQAPGDEQQMWPGTPLPTSSLVHPKTMWLSPPRSARHYHNCICGSSHCNSFGSCVGTISMPQVETDERGYGRTQSPGACWRFLITLWRFAECNYKVLRNNNGGKTVVSVINSEVHGARKGVLLSPFQARALQITEGSQLKSKKITPGVGEQHLIKKKSSSERQQ